MRDLVDGEIKNVNPCRTMTQSFEFEPVSLKHPSNILLVFKDKGEDRGRV